MPYNLITLLMNPIEAINSGYNVGSRTTFLQEQ
jgi:hypothetical protein